MKPFTDVEGSHGEGTPMQAAAGVVFRLFPPGYVLNWHCAPRRQYSITLSGVAEIEVGGVPGMEMISAVATMKPTDLPGTQGGKALGAYSKALGAFSKTLQVKLKGQPAGEAPTAAVIRFYTVKN